MNKNFKKQRIRNSLREKKDKIILKKKKEKKNVQIEKKN